MGISRRSFLVSAARLAVAAALPVSAAVRKPAYPAQGYLMLYPSFDVYKKVYYKAAATHAKYKNEMRVSISPMQSFHQHAQVDGKVWVYIPNGTWRPAVFLYAADFAYDFQQGRNVKTRYPEMEHPHFYRQAPRSLYEV